MEALIYFGLAEIMLAILALGLLELGSLNIKMPRRKAKLDITQGRAKLSSIGQSTFLSGIVSYSSTEEI